MDNIKWLNILLLLLCAYTSLVSCQYPPNVTPLTGTNAVTAPTALYANRFLSCIEANQNTRFPVGLTMEGLISLIERLEDNLANTTDNNLNKIKGAEQVARFLLKRFRLDGYNEEYEKQDQRDLTISQITDTFLNDNSMTFDNTYYFPDYVYSQQELCALLFSFSHSIANTNSVKRQSAPLFRGKRQAVVRNPVSRQSSYNNFQEPVGSRYLAQSSSINSTRYPIREEGVVSFRGNKLEAIATARVLIGVIAGLFQNAKTQVKEILAPLEKFDSQFDKAIDPVLAVTLGDLWGSGVAPTAQVKTYQYGLSGEWHSTSCTTHYSLINVPETDFSLAFSSSKGTKAEIRGGLDGYIIGLALKNIQLSDPTRLRLSTILRTYYAKPKQTSTATNAFTVSYCDRTSRSQIALLQETAHLYNAIYQYKSSSIPGSNWLQEFPQALSIASQVETQGLSDYCSQRPSGVLDRTAPCETPSDILYFIDGASVSNLQISADVVTTVNGNLLLTRRGGGTVSVFINSPGRNSVNNNIQLPAGPGDWPLVCAAFNTSNPGFASCRIEDFNATTSTLTPVPNLGKYFYFVNQTLFNYKYWNPRVNFTGVPGKSVVLIDLSNIPQPESNQDRNDYNYYKDQLRYRHRDVRYLGASQSTETFKDLLRDQNDRDTPGSVGSPNYQLGPNFAARVCDNPAVFQWPDCYRRRSDNAQYVGYVTPGFKQNWAMYSEYFLKSFDIYFKFKAELGSIRVCYDRSFPPERQDDNHCKDINANEEKSFPTISNPCKGQSFESCAPFYFTVWGKESQTQCLDDACSSLDQIKWTVTHSGVQCSSSHHLLPSFTFQIIVASFASIFYLFFNNNKS